MPKAMLAGPSNDAALQLLLLYLWMLFLCIDLQNLLILLILQILITATF